MSNSSQVLQILKLDLVNSQITETHISENLLDFKFLHVSSHPERKMKPTSILDPKTHQALTVFNVILPATLLCIAIILLILLYRAGKKANDVSIRPFNFLHY